MMVPRTFLFTSSVLQHQLVMNDVRESESAQSPQSFPAPRKSIAPTHNDRNNLPICPPEPSLISQTSPVIIPPKRHPRSAHVNSDSRYTNIRPFKKSARSLSRSSSTSTLNHGVPQSVASLLESTAIPVPRRSWNIRNSRRLPPGNHVEDFSRLLLEGVPSRNENSPIFDGSANSTLDVLLSPPDENNQKSILGMDSDSPTPLSLRSVSTDSIPSLDQEWESFSLSSLSTPVTGIVKKPLTRRKQFSPPQDCATDHPLLEAKMVEPLESIFLRTPSISAKKHSTTRTFPKLGSTFKSNLTASLRAIKSAAQSVSNFATPSVQPDDFLTRSLFTITPELTDDRRPHLSGLPSPALRRYLNPITLSPSEMHVYHERPQDSAKRADSSPVSIQMQTYNRTGSKQHQFFTSASGSQDQQYDLEVPPTRQREPRENGDFLRMVVLEMNMRRNGKLRDDIPTRAKVWLPPRKIGPSRLMSADGNAEESDNAIPQRWIGVAIDSV
jgi:hypothetical protein